MDAEKMKKGFNNFLRNISLGNWGSPKIEIGQTWVLLRGNNPFDDRDKETKYVITDVIGNYVRYDVILSPTNIIRNRSEPIGEFRWIRELIA